MEKEYNFLTKLRPLFFYYKDKSKREIEDFLNKYIKEYKKLINPSYKAMNVAKKNHKMDQIKMKEFHRGYECGINANKNSLDSKRDKVIKRLREVDLEDSPLIFSHKTFKALFDEVPSPLHNKEIIDQLIFLLGGNNE